MNPVTSRSRLATVGLLVLVAWLVVYPLLLVLAESVHSPEGWTLGYVQRFISEPREWHVLWNSVWISVASVALSALIGIPLAFLFEWFNFPGRRMLGALVALPVVLPPLVGVVAFLFLYGETGFAARLVQAVFGLEEAPWRLEGAWAILLVHAYSMYVYFYLLTRAGLDRLDPAMLEAAASLGAGRWRMLRRVVVPLLGPSLLGAALLTFMTALASFSAPYIFGGGFRVMPTQIVFTRLNGEYGMAMVQTVALSLVALAGLWLLRGSAGHTGTRGQKGTATRTAPHREPSGSRRGHRGRMALRGVASAAPSHPAAVVVCPHRDLDYPADSPFLHHGQLHRAVQ